MPRPLATATHIPSRFTLYLLRHGEVASNAAGLRCGGEIDEALSPEGLAQMQARADAWRSGRPAWRPGLVLCGDLLRARRSAEIVAAALGLPSPLASPLLKERRLGAWNGRPQAENEAALRAGVTPPGGESETDFAARVEQALTDLILPRMAQAPLIVTSKGVARKLFECLGGSERLLLDNAELVGIDSLLHEGKRQARLIRPV